MINLSKAIITMNIIAIFKMIFYFHLIFKAYSTFITFTTFTTFTTSIASIAITRPFIINIAYSNPFKTISLGKFSTRLHAIYKLIAVRNLFAI